MALPYSGLNHPAPQSLLADLNVVSFRQLLTGEGRSEVMPFRLGQLLYRPRPDLLANAPIGSPSS
jgi:hypothetical protein